MSDLMLLGILRMPLNMVEADQCSLIQFVQCANGAADRIESDAKTIEQLREDLQAAKLLAHANEEMFRAEKAEHALLKETMREPVLMLCQFPGGGSWTAEGVNERVAEEAFSNCADTVTIYYGGRRVFDCLAAFHNHVHARDCPKCGQKDVPANVYCKGMDCPLNPSCKPSD
ncbi:hypothetical protein [Burkholderia pseudomallei]|uniref:hypothetical protein n=1 Tax=Burkholderia pseudomallei TaxID=28450 RepID=UPI000A1A27CE|nr:hypothetical protein [Burkholderia pseudomallei]ARL91004.1 hypothetical protein BOC57_35065 [Burkholderia pseudomallei]